MENIARNVDFTKVAENCRPYIDREHPDFILPNPSGTDDQKKAVREFTKLSFEAFPTYLASYLNMNGFMPSSSRTYRFNKSSVDSVLRDTSHYVDASARKALQLIGQWRSSDCFPLAKEEMQSGLDFEKKNPAWEKTVALLQDTICRYLVDFNEVLAQLFDPRDVKSQGPYDENFGKFFRAFRGEAAGSSFLSELSPIMALSLSAFEDKMDERAFAMALCDTFRAKALESMEKFEFRRNGKDAKISYSRNQCPFGPVLGGIAGIVLKEDKNGFISLSEERRSGALFAFLYEKVLQNSKAALITLPNNDNIPER